MDKGCRCVLGLEGISGSQKLVHVIDEEEGVDVAVDVSQHVVMEARTSWNSCPAPATNPKSHSEDS